MKILISVATEFMEPMDWPGEILEPAQGNDADVWIVDPEHPARSWHFDLMPNLKVLLTASTGTNHIDLEDACRRGIQVFSLLDDREGLEKIRASGEFTFFLILAALRRLQRLTFSIYSKGWFRQEHAMRGNELYGKAVGIIGMGRNGRNVFKWCSAFDVDRFYLYDPPAGMDHSLEEVFQKSDIVVITCALTEQTIDMIGKNHVQSMKIGACVINTSRGEIVRESELVEALLARPDIIYATDVLSGMTDGTHLNSRLFDLNNVIITPHVAGLTVESNTKALAICNKLLWEWYRGSYTQESL